MPNKSYYSSNVKGNNITLGLTNNTDNIGLIGSSNNGLYQYKNIYGENVGTTASGAGVSVNLKSLGLTTDSSKSGIIVEPDTDIKLVIKY